MAKLTEMGTRFSSLNWTDRLSFMEVYREKRASDLAAAQEFDLAKQAKSTKAREKKVKEPKVPGTKTRAAKGDSVKVNKDQLSLLQQLGLC